jgi:hypothetical protein
MTEIQGADDLNKLQRAFSHLSGAGLSKFKRKVTYFVATAIKGVIQPYKPIKYTHTRKDGTKGVKWPSDAARKAYFAERTERDLPMKYTRGSDPMSQRLQQSWVVHSRKESATVGNRATYAPYVASDEFQTEQHKATGFTTDKQAADQVIESGVMDKIVNTHIKGMMDEAFRGL